ncbi:glycoside hydrolase family 5 protein [Rathayibacter tritici]|uniref:Glycoside hydrolase family 5 domain-containing protein n=1 Tax=Rathayibacter tritici TaxID=33888 RepID=A0A160KTP0_9MICO|nr:cellulase family glycosylhydrolase [Rathayibacter tritici]AND16879.1 hypothetical protein A6122_1748 [Rathayibacter tritici]
MAVLLVPALVIVAGRLLEPGTRSAPVACGPSSATTVDSESVVASPVVTPSGDDYLGKHAFLRGVNVFDLQARVDVGVDCTAANPVESYDYLAGRGLSLVRLAVPWSLLQPQADGESTDDALAKELDPDAVALLRSEIEAIGAAGMRVVLDLHNNGTYPASQGELPEGTVWFGSGISVAQAQRVWTLLATQFLADGRIAAYDLFNEVKRALVPVATYKAYMQAVVTAIRDTGDRHTIWVEGMREGATGTLAAIAPDGPWIQDPLKRIVYSQHFYPGGTGTTLRSVKQGGVEEDLFVGSLTIFGRWCQRYTVHCSVGEVGWPSDESLVLATGGVGSWTDLGEAFYAVADVYGLDVTYFGSTRKPDCGWLMAYCGDDHEINDARSQSAVIEEHLSR